MARCVLASRVRTELCGRLPSLLSEQGGGEEEEEEKKKRLGLTKYKEEGGMVRVVDAFFIYLCHVACCSHPACSVCNCSRAGEGSPPLFVRRGRYSSGQ